MKKKTSPFLTKVLLMNGNPPYSILSAYLGMPFSRSFPYMKTVDLHLLRMEERGVMRRWQAVYDGGGGGGGDLDCSKDEEEEEEHWNAGLDSTVAFFALLAAGAAASLAAAAGEAAVARRRRRGAKNSEK